VSAAMEDLAREDAEACLLAEIEGHAHNEARASLVAELVAAAMAGSLERMDLAAKRLRTHVNSRDE